MSESPFDERDIAHFAYPRYATDGKRRLRIDYRGIIARFDWPDTKEGQSDLLRLMGALPDLMESARGEMDIYNTMRDIDSEIETLLGGNGPDCEEDEK